MRRAAALLLATTAPLLVLVSAGTSTALAGPGVGAAFELKATNGLTGQVATTGSSVDLVLAGHHEIAAYSVRGTVSAQGVEARFGELGRISVRFHPDGSHSGAKPGECVGKKFESGVFVGTIEFRGERGYTKIDATRARGCLRHSHARATPNIPGAGASAAEEEREVAILTVKAGTRQLRAAGFREPDGSGQAEFTASVLERRGPMRIARAAIAPAKSPAFVFDQALGTATVSPPEPFSGTASFERHPDGSTSWTGNLSVSLLGIAPVPLTGSAFKASLRPGFDN
jgi:hypothetical protein